MYNIFSEIWRVAYGDLCFLRRNAVSVTVASIIGPLLYLIAFGFGMRSGDTESGVDYIAYVVPGIVAISSMNAGYSSSSQKIVIQRLFHTSFDELVLCPMHTSSIVLGKSVIGMIRGMIGGVVMLALGLLFTGDLHITAGLILAMLFSCLTFSLLGVMAGLLAKSSSTLTMLSSLLILPMTFMCGTLFSVDSLPSVISGIVWALPLTHSSEIIRSLALGWDFPWISLAMLAAYFLAFYIADRTIISKKLY